MKTTTSYDVIIVGARAAGATTAMLLARRGLRVLAVDRSRYGSDTLSTHALMRPAVMQLYRWGLLERVKESGTTPVKRVVFHYPDEDVPVDLAASDGIDALYAPRRTVLDRLLVDAAREAGAEVRFGVIIDDILQDDSGRVYGVSARDEQGNSFALESDFVVGADGIRSIVAQAVEAPILRRANNSGAIVYGHFKDVELQGYEWSYAPGVSAGAIPTNDDQSCVFVGGSEQMFRQNVFPNLEEGFMRVLRQASPDVADRVARGTTVARFRGFAGVRGYTRQCQGPGWALVGDAGYFRDPITAHGISDAFRDAELLSRSLTGESDPAAYQRARDEVITDLFDVTDRIAGYAWTMDEIRVHLRNLSRSMKPETKLITELDAVRAA